MIRWEQLIWPEVPELGYGGRVEHDGVTLVEVGRSVIGPPYR